MSFDSSVEKKHELRREQNVLQICFCREYHRLWLLIRSNVKTKTKINISYKPDVTLVFISLFLFNIVRLMILLKFFFGFFVCCRASSEFHNSMILSIKNCNKTTHSSQILGLNSLQLGFHWIISFSSLEFVQGEIQRPHTPNAVQKMCKNYTPKFALLFHTLYRCPIIITYRQWLRYARTSRYWCANTFTCKIIRLYLKAIIIYLHFSRINSMLNAWAGWLVVISSKTWVH